MCVHPCVMCVRPCVICVRPSVCVWAPQPGHPPSCAPPVRGSGTRTSTASATSTRHHATGTARRPHAHADAAPGHLGGLEHGSVARLLEVLLGVVFGRVRAAGGGGAASRVDEGRPVADGAELHDQNGVGLFGFDGVAAQAAVVHRLLAIPVQARAARTHRTHVPHARTGRIDRRTVGSEQC